MQAHVPKANLTGGAVYSKYFDAFPRFLTSTTLAVVQNHLTRAREKAVSQAETVFIISRLRFRNC